MVGDAVLGAELAPFPSPLPPASGGAGPVRSLPVSSSLDLLRPFVLQMVGSMFRPINYLSLSLAIPQFKLVTHKSSL